MAKSIGSCWRSCSKDASMGRQRWHKSPSLIQSALWKHMELYETYGTCEKVTELVRIFFHCFFGVKILFPCATWWSFFCVYCVSLHSSKSSAVRRFGRGWTAGLSKQQVIGETARRVLHDADKVMLYDVTWIATVVKHGEHAKFIGPEGFDRFLATIQRSCELHLARCNLPCLKRFFMTSCWSSFGRSQQLPA